MTDEPKPDGKKAVHPALFVGPAVAIGAALFAVLITTGNRKDTTPTPAETTTGSPVDDQVATVQSSPFGQAEAASPDTPATPPAPGDDIPVSADGSPAFADETLEFSATIPAGPTDDPVLKRLRADAQAYFAKYKAEARADFDERKRQGAMALAWEGALKWTYTAKASGIVSLVGTAYEFKGGAHGMTYTDTEIARADTGEKLTLQSMLMPDRSPSPAITIAVCEALKTEKIAQIGSATIYDEPIVCAGTNANIKIEDAKFALAPSTEKDRFGGLYVYYEPYAVGSYSEGDYTLKIPQVVFREDMRPEFKSLFAGAVPPSN